MTLQHHGSGADLARLHHPRVTDPRRRDLDEQIERLTRRRAEAEYFAEQLIEALNAIDGDPDLEDGDQDVDIADEPHDDRELEPSIGAPDGRLDQRRWAQGGEGCHEQDFDTPFPARLSLMPSHLARCEARHEAEAKLDAILARRRGRKAKPGARGSKPRLVFVSGPYHGSAQ